jgi:hypothetical protein
VDGIPGADEPFAHSARNEDGSGGPAKNFERNLSIDCVASAVFVRPNGESRRHARQQGRVAKALSRLEDIHHLVLVTQLDRTLANDEKLGRRRAVLDQNVGASRVGPDRDRCSDMQQFVSGKRIEWGKLSEEIGDLIHGANRGGV